MARNAFSAPPKRRTGDSLTPNALWNSEVDKARTTGDLGDSFGRFENALKVTYRKSTSIVAADTMSIAITTLGREDAKLPRVQAILAR